MGSLLGGSGRANRRRAGAAEADKGDNKGEASAEQTTIRPMVEGKEKSDEQEDDEGERGKEIRRIWTCKKFSNFHRLSHPPRMLPGYRGAFLI